MWGDFNSTDWFDEDDIPSRPVDYHYVSLLEQVFALKALNFVGGVTRVGVPPWNFFGRYIWAANEVEAWYRKNGWGAWQHGAFWVPQVTRIHNNAFLVEFREALVYPKLKPFKKIVKSQAELDEEEWHKREVDNV